MPRVFAASADPKNVSGLAVQAAASVGAIAGASSLSAEAGVNSVAGSIRNVNPTGSMQNCTACAIATDATLGGSPASAVPGGPFNVVQSVTTYKPGAVGIPANGPAGIDLMMTGWGPGSRGIVWGTRGAAQGHVFNVVGRSGISTVRSAVPE